MYGRDVGFASTTVDVTSNVEIRRALPTATEALGHGMINVDAE